MLLALFLLAPVESVAQALGTAYWRLDPYCNTLVLTVIQEGAVYRLLGYEDPCTDNAEYATVEGTAIVQTTAGASIVSLGLSTINGRLIGIIEDLSTLDGLWNDPYGQGRLLASPGVSRGSAAPRRPRGATAFLHVAESLNSIGNISCFSHPLTDGNPGALIAFSRHRGKSSELLPQLDAIVSLYYDDDGTGLSGPLGNDVWCFSRNDSNPIPSGAGFSVHVLPRR